jgi:hypothetical protein
MEISEKELEDLIFETDNEYLNERGLNIYGKKKRQISTFKHGILDLLTYRRYKDDFNNNYLEINIIELKKDQIDINTLNQIIRYARGVQDFMQGRGNYNYFITLTLIGNSVNLSNDIFAYLPILINSYSISCTCIFSIEYYIYRLKWDGIYFENININSLENKIY